MIGARVKRLRIARGMTQKDLAEPKYTYAYVSYIESGRRNPSKEAVEHLASKLGVTPDELLTGRPADLIPRLDLRLQEARVAMSEGRMEEADETLRTIAKEAKRYRVPRLEARAEEGLGLWFERHGQPEEGLVHYEHAEELLRSEPSTEWVDAVAGKARCLEAMGDARYAIFVLESLLDRLDREKLRDPDALSRLHASLVFAYLDAGIYRQAAESARELEALAPRMGDPLRVAQMHMNVARLFLQEGRIDEAKHSLRRAEENYRHLNLKTEMAGAHLALGYVGIWDGDLQAARAELELAVDMFEETANTPDLTRALNELAKVEHLERRNDRAVELLERSISIIGSSDTPILAEAHRELGRAIGGSDPSLAEKHLRTAIELYERTGQTFEIAITYRALGDLFDGRGETDAACDAYRTGIMALEAPG
jgi:tetratricopeptide (TPR) repeat protein